jgi:tetratricopeptide (TPR) repeat protein
MSWPRTGRLGEQPFARIFGTLATTGFTGALRVAQDNRNYALWWRDGVIVDADSASPEDTLGRVALEAGLIDSAVLADSVRRMAMNPAKRQMEIFLETGVLKPEMAMRVARMALSRRALRLFALNLSSTYTVEEVAHERNEGGPVEPRWALYRGLRQFYDERRLENELPELPGQAIKLAVDAGAIQDAFAFTDDERILLAYLAKGYWELPDLVDACLTLARPVVVAIVAALASFSTLDIQPANSVPRLRKRAREATQRMSKDALMAGAPPPTGPSDPARARPISQQLEPLRPSLGTPPQGSFRVPTGASSPKVTTEPPGSPRLAPIKVTTEPPAAAPMVQFKVPTAPPPATSQPVPPPQRPPAAQSSFRVPSTRPLASPPTQNPPPARTGPNVTAGNHVIAGQLRDQILAKFGQVETNADHFQILELSRDAGAAQVKAAYFQLAKTYHPDRLGLVNLTDLRPQVERIFAKLSDAFATLGDDARRKEYMNILAQGGEAAIKKRNDEEVAKANKILSAEEHFRKGEMALRRQMFPMAVEEFGEAVELNPEEGEHHAMLAWSVWCNANEKEAVFNEVKKGMHKAVELNPKCVAAFFFLGQVYKHMNDMDRAYNSFQKTLNLQPGHVDAEREIRLIEMRKSKGPDKKGGGLFDRFKKK